MSFLQLFDPEFEYAEQCYQYLLKREQKILIFHNRSPQLQYRDQLIKRINFLYSRHKLSIGVKFLSVYIMDLFMDSHDICEDSLELTAVSSLLIAAKVDENDSKIPKIEELVSDPNQYLKSEAMEMEVKILEFFNWVLMTPTAATYIDYFYVKCIPESMINKISRSLVDKYLEESLEIRFYSFYPSIIAASVIYCVRLNLGLEPIWPLMAESVTKYSFSQIEGCVFELRKYEFLSITPKRFFLCDVRQLNLKTRNDSGFFDCDNC